MADTAEEEATTNLAKEETTTNATEAETLTHATEAETTTNATKAETMTNATKAETMTNATKAETMTNATKAETMKKATTAPTMTHAAGEIFQDPEDDNMLSAALTSADEASQQIDEDVRQEAGFFKRTLVEDEGASVGDYTGTADLWYPRQNTKSKSKAKSKMTPEKCRDLCEGKADCKSFSFVSSGEGWCGLKSKCVTETSLAKKFPEDYWRTWFVQKATSQWHARSLVEDEGIEIATKQHQTVDSCKSSCAREPKCSSFTWLAAARMCHLKDKCLDETAKASTKKEAKSYKTYYKPCRKWVMRELVLDQGKTIETLTAPLQECLDKCIGHSKCKSVSFKPIGNGCKLHDKEVTTDTPVSSDVQGTVFSTYYRPC